MGALSILHWLIAIFLFLIPLGAFVWFALRRQAADYRPLGILSPILIFFVAVGLVGRPFLEQLRKHTWLADIIPTAVLVPLSILLLVGLYVSVVATMYFFFRAMRNINFFTGHRVVASSAAWLMAIPFANLVVMPYVWGRTYYLSHSLNPQHRIRKSTAAIMAVGTFVLVLIGLATDRLSDNQTLWPPGYDGLSLAVVALCTSTAGSILFSRIVQRISAAQRLHAERQGLLSPWRDRAHEPSSSGLLAALRLAVVGLCVGTALFAAAFPSSASGMLRRLFASVGQVALLQGERTSSLSRMLQEAAREVNRVAPQQIDAITRLERARVEDNQLVYEYVLTPNRLSAQEISGLLSNVRSDVVPAFCTGEFRGYRQAGAVLVFRYLDSQGQRIGQVVVSESDCP